MRPSGNGKDMRGGGKRRGDVGERGVDVEEGKVSEGIQGRERYEVRHWG